MPAVAAATDAAPLTTPLRLHSACMDDRIERPDLSWISVPTAFWATSTTVSKKPTQKMHAARASPLPDQPAKATTVARTMVPPTATGTAGKQAISRDGNTEDRSDSERGDDEAEHPGAQAQPFHHEGIPGRQGSEDRPVADEEDSDAARPCPEFSYQSLKIRARIITCNDQIARN